MADRARGPGARLVAGLLVGGVVAALLGAWWWANDRPACRGSTDFGTCMGSGLLVAVLGVPLALAFGWCALRIGGARHAVLGVGAIIVVVWGAVLLAEPLEPPAAAWPLVSAALAVGYLVVEARLRRTSSRDGS